MGIAGVITVASTLLYGLTVLPALLALLGPRVNRLACRASFLRLQRTTWRTPIAAGPRGVGGSRRAYAPSGPDRRPVLALC
jgi:RND superfamily putative drug exporter